MDFWMGKLQNKTIFKNIFLKGTVSIISSDLPCKNGNAWFTMLPLKALSDPDELEIKVFRFLCESDLHISCL